MDPIDVTDLRWRWAEALARMPAGADPELDEFMRTTVGDLLTHADERNRLAAKVAELKALLEA